MNKFRYHPLGRRSTCCNARYVRYSPILAKAFISIKFAPILQVKGFAVIFFAKFGQSAGIGTFEASEDKHHVDLLAELDGGFHSYRLRLERDEETGQAVADAARQQGWPLRELRRDDRSLEQVFRELTETVGEVTP